MTGSAFLCPRCLLRISDDGRGAAKETVAALNGREKKTALREHGLGLRVVRHIAEKYRWRIRYSSSEGGGFAAELTMRLPLSLFSKSKRN